jgi:hypothetical protein
MNFNGAMRAESGAAKQARGDGIRRPAGAGPKPAKKRMTPKGAFTLPFRLRADPGRRDGYVGMEFLVRRMEEYARRVEAAKELLRRGRTPRSIFDDELPQDCLPEPERRVA